VSEALAMMIGRGMITEDLRPVPGQEGLLQFYAASVPDIL
jgi:hypothetical protein